MVLDSLFESAASEPRNLLFVVILGWSECVKVYVSGDTYKILTLF